MKPPLPAGEEPEVAVAEHELVVAEQELTRRTARSVTAGDRAEHARAPITIEHELAHADAEVVVPALAREARELRQQRGLHGLEQQDAGCGR